MGNSNSQPEEGSQPKNPRPSLKTFSSSATIKAGKAGDIRQSPSGSSLSNAPGQSKRRKSIELPDLDPSLAFTAATPHSSTHHTPTGTTAQPSWISGSEWRGKGKAAPPAASRGNSFDAVTADIHALPTLRPGDEVFLSGNADDRIGTSARTAEPLPINVDLAQQNEGHASSLTSSHAADLSMESDLASETDDGEHEYDPLHPIPLPKDTTQIPTFDQIPKLEGLGQAKPRQTTPTSTTGSPRTIIGDIPPLHPPEDTIVAPAIPAAVGPEVPLGSGASAFTALIVGSPFGSPSLDSEPVATSTAAILADPSKSHLLETAAPESPPLPSPASETAGGLGLTLPASIALPPLPSPLPAAAPLVVLAGDDILRNPEAAEAVKAATVDLGAGADGVPTLLTWTPGEGAGKEGGAAEGASAPQQVYVTGTFAKGWTTKIELRKKKSQQDFSAIVNLPPGPHRLKFIVDTQWKTSKNLPSGTDQEGNLINYLQVSKNDTQLAHNDSAARFQTPEDIARYMGTLQEDGWTSEIPAELIAFGEECEAAEAALDAHENLNQQRAEQNLPPLDMPDNPNATQHVPPPSLPAQLQKGVLNQSASHPVGSGDDNSILPKPDHTVIDHLAAAPMNKGFLSVGVTKRYRRKFVTTVLYKPVPAEMAN